MWIGACPGDSCGAGRGGWRLKKDEARFLHTLALSPALSRTRMVDPGGQITGETPDQEGGNLKPLASRALNREGPMLRFLSCVLVHLASQYLGARRLSCHSPCLSVGRCTTRSKGIKNLPRTSASQCKGGIAPRSPEGRGWLGSSS